MKNRNPRHEPMFNVPERLPVLMVGILVFLYALKAIGLPVIGAFESRVGWLLPLSIPDVALPMHLVRLFGYSFFHGSWMHVLGNSAMLFIFGIITLQSIRAKIRDDRSGKNPELLFLSIFFFGVLAGGIFQWLVWGIQYAVTGPVSAYAIGASAGISALWPTAGWAMGGRNRMIGFTVANLLFNALIMLFDLTQNTGISWAAHIGGLIAGYILAPMCLKPNTAR